MVEIGEIGGRCDRIRRFRNDIRLSANHILLIYSKFMDHTMHWRGEHEHEPEGNEDTDPAYELLLPGEHNAYRDRPKR